MDKLIYGGASPVSSCIREFRRKSATFQILTTAWSICYNASNGIFQSGIISLFQLLTPYLLRCFTVQGYYSMAQIKVNGEAQAVELPLNVTQLIRLNNVDQPDMVSVQVNEEFADRADWDSIQLKDGDEVDFLYFMGGGAV